MARSPVTPLSVTLHNHRTWADAKLELQRSGVVFVRGRHARLKTSSGVGKTSLLSSLRYLLGLGDPTTKTTSWGAEDSVVVGDFEVGGERWRISRGTDGVSLQIGDAKKLTGREAEKKIREIVGSPDVFRALTWRRQRSRGSFFSSAGTARRQLLADLLGLSEFEAAAERCRSAGEAFRSSLPSLTVAASAARGEVQRLAEEVASLEAQQHQLEPEGVSVREQISMLEAEECALREHPPLLAELQSLLASSSAANRAAHQRLAEARGDEARLLAMRSGTCPTCGGKVGGPDPQALASARSRLEVALASAAGSDTDLRAMDEALAELRKDDAGRTSALSAVRVALAELRALERQTAQTAADRAARAERLSRSRGSLAEARSRLVDVESRINLAQAGQAEMADLAHLLRGFVVAITSEVLRDLSSETNALLASVPNVSSCAVEFFPGDGHAGRKEVVHRLTIDAAERSDEDLSGGQEVSMELVVDVAFQRIIRGRAKNVPTWTHIDEPFEGMGAADREAFVELLAQDEGHLYLIVDHSREFGERFAREGIGVELDAVSRIVSESERASW